MKQRTLCGKRRRKKEVRQEMISKSACNVCFGPLIDAIEISIEMRLLIRLENSSSKNDWVRVFSNIFYYHCMRFVVVFNFNFNEIEPKYLLGFLLSLVNRRFELLEASPQWSYKIVDFCRLLCDFSHDKHIWRAESNRKICRLCKLATHPCWLWLSRGTVNFNAFCRYGLIYAEACIDGWETWSRINCYSERNDLRLIHSRHFLFSAVIRSNEFNVFIWLCDKKLTFASTSLWKWHELCVEYEKITSFWSQSAACNH